MMHLPAEGESAYPATALLDTDETASHVPPKEPLPQVEGLRDDYRLTPILPEEVEFRHSGWTARRRNVWDALVRTVQSPARLDRFRNCGSGCVVEWHPEEKRWRLSANYCRDRCCQPCGAARSHQVEAALRSWIDDRPLRFVTLTLRHTPHLTLAEQLKRLYDCFGCLRRRIWWKDKVKGGVAILELKLGHDALWHPHLHILLESKFLPQKGLSHEWFAVTGDSYIVDVRLVGGTDNELRYVCKYVGKPLDSSVYNRAPMLDEFVRAIKGKRLILPFGTWHKLNLDAESKQSIGWITIGSLAGLIADAQTDEHAQSVLNILNGIDLARTEMNLSTRLTSDPDG